MALLGLARVSFACVFEPCYGNGFWVVSVYWDRGSKFEFVLNTDNNKGKWLETLD